MKPIKIVLKRRGKIRQSNREMNVIKVHYMHVWKCHNGATLYN
jgi:hypothetical protein